MTSWEEKRTKDGVAAGEGAKLGGRGGRSIEGLSDGHRGDDGDEEDKRGEEAGHNDE